MTNPHIAPVMAGVSNDPSKLDPEERMNVEQIRDIQLGRLKWTLRHAYDNVEAYRKLYDEAGVHPDDLKTLDDLKHFPCTDKEFLRSNYPFKALAVPMDQVRRVHASSGTTGQPTVVAYTEEDLQNWGRIVARCFRMAGVQPGDMVQNAFGYGLFTGGLGMHYGAEAMSLTVIPMSGGQTDKQIQVIQDFGPTAILATPTYLLTIGDAMQRQGIDPRRTKLRTAILGAEPWTEPMRQEIEEMFDIKACDIYGLSEVLGPGVAGESCETQDGSHLWEDMFLPEIVDPDMQPLADEQEGELVFTSLGKHALPIVRYRTKDLTRLLPGTARPGHRRMERISGRVDDMIILRGVNIFPSQIEQIILEQPALSPHFILEITRPGRMDELTVRVERRHDSTTEDGYNAAKMLARGVKVRIGSSCAVQIAEPGELARSEGKLKRIYDLRPDAPSHGQG
ncbi:phenylacetate--CoA ligase family protein [Luteococcus sp. OSA5]|uniref:phenylacetate--CoA ligase family protein n=1 Tax=Luteococcus sp. OSA5 TaxID=3401630 RepID=UPI003B436CD2